MQTEAHPHLLEEVNLEEKIDFFLRYVDSFLKKALLYSYVFLYKYQLKL